MSHTWLSRTIQSRSTGSAYLVRQCPRRRSPQIRGDHERKSTSELFQSTINLPSDIRHLLYRIDINLARKRRLCPAHETSEHLACLSRIVVDGLFTHDHDVDAVRLTFDERFERFGDTERFGGGGGFGNLDVDGRVGAHGECCPEGLGRFRWADSDDFDGLDGVFEAFPYLDCLFHRWGGAVIRVKKWWW